MAFCQKIHNIPIIVSSIFRNIFSTFLYTVMFIMLQALSYMNGAFLIVMYNLYTFKNIYYEPSPSIKD